MATSMLHAFQDAHDVEDVPCTSEDDHMLLAGGKKSVLQTLAAEHGVENNLVRKDGGNWFRALTNTANDPVYDIFHQKHPNIDRIDRTDADGNCLFRNFSSLVRATHDTPSPPTTLTPQPNPPTRCTARRTSTCRSARCASSR